MKRNITLCLIVLLSFGATQAQYRYAGKVLGFSREYNPYPESWSANQALGEPNVYPQYDDINGAWTPLNYGKQRDTLILGFENNSPIDSVLIWETSGAGIIDSVYIKNPGTGKWVLVFGRKGQHYEESEDTLARILRIGFPMTSYNVNEVRIELANDSADDWVEIDAVAIHPKTLTTETYSPDAGKSAQFDGVDDYYRTSFSQWNLTYNNAFTMMAWVKVTADTAPIVSNYAYRGAGIIHSADYTETGISLSNINSTGDSLYAYVNSNRRAQLGLPYTKNQWQHIAMVSTKDSLKAYLNGVLFASTQGSGFDSLDAYGIMEFGRNYDYESYFKGEIDEVKMYNRALTAAEILKQKYTIGEGSKISNLVGYWQFNQTDSFFWNSPTHRFDSLHNGGIFGATGTILSTLGLNKNELQLLPNPNTGKFKVNFEKPLTSQGQLSILDLSGKTVYEQTIPSLSTEMNIDFTQWIKGVYVLQIQAANLNGSIQFIVQ